MTIKREETIRDFDFWGDAEKTTAKLTYKEWDQIEAVLEEIYPDGMTATELNDMFRFELDETLAFCGLDITEEDLLARTDD